ncbi:MAG: NADH-ubiquinone oxidoreductase-F iron-sulfur binding region domain-containing protein [Marmoricola sp.]
MTDLLPGPDDPTVAAPRGPDRLLGPDHAAPIPQLDTTSLLALVEEAGLTGRGGAGFPTARKLLSVSGRSSGLSSGRARVTRPVVVGNAMEGEPLSHKDAVLLTQAPHLVVEGLVLLGTTLRARRMVLAVGPEIQTGPVTAAARGTRVEVRQLTGGFVAGQESALVNQLNGRAGVPTDPLVPVFRRGVDDRPTLVLNAETLAQLALVARYGPAWFRAQGTTADPGTFLTTISGSDRSLVRHPGVLEVSRGTTLRTALKAAGTDLPRVAAVLVGGYHGAWVPAAALDTPLSRDGLRPFGASPGAGVLHALAVEACPLQTAAAVTHYLAGQSARQCGPCLNGLPRIAQTLRGLAVPGASAELVVEVERLRVLVTGRGACAHPDGTARFVASTMRIFSRHVEDHLKGYCHAATR